MSDYIKIAVIVIIGCLLISITKEIKKEYSLPIALLCGFTVLIFSLNDIAVLKDSVQNFAELSDINQSAMRIFFKAVAISIICQFAGEVCADTGNRFIMFCIEFSGKSAILITSIPLVSAVLKIVSNYIGV